MKLRTYIDPYGRVATPVVMVELSAVLPDGTAMVRVGNLDLPLETFVDERGAVATPMVFVKPGAFNPDGTIETAPPTSGGTSGPAAYTDEQARDAIGAALRPPEGFEWIVDDGGDTIRLQVVDPAIVRVSLELGALARRSKIGDADWSGDPLAIAHGGTGAANEAEARAALQLSYASAAEAVAGTVSGKVVSPATMKAAIAATLAPGIDGKSLRYGSGAPANTLGVDGDFYIEPTNQTLYGPKAGGAWPNGVSFKGGAGVPGTPGAAATISGVAVNMQAPGSTPSATVTPGAGNSYSFTLNIPRATDGTNGTNGSNGSPGTPGAAATISGVAVSLLVNGATPTGTVTPGAGNSYAFAFGIPAAKDGKDGKDGTNGAPGAPGLLEAGLTITGDTTFYIPCRVAMTIDQGNAPLGTGSVAYAKSTGGAPGTFTNTALPAAMEAGSWLRGVVTGVSGFLALDLVRTD